METGIRILAVVITNSIGARDIIDLPTGHFPDRVLGSSDIGYDHHVFGLVGIEHRVQGGPVLIARARGGNDRRGGRVDYLVEDRFPQHDDPGAMEVRHCVAA